MQSMIRFIILTLLSIATLTANAQIHWIQTNHDFGVFNEDDGPVTCLFKFVNQSIEPVAITSARATCGCTIPSYPTNSIAPGDTAQISVTYNPEFRPGRFSKKIYITTSASTSKTTLEVKGVVVGSETTIARKYPVDCGPLKLAHSGIMLGEIYKGRVKTVYAEGYNRSADSLQIKVLYKPEFIDLVVAPEIAPAGEQVSLIAYVNSNRCDIYGLVEDSITISPIPGETYTLPVTLMINEDFSGLSNDNLKNAPIIKLNNTTLDYGEVPLSEGMITRTFEISNLGKSKLEIRRIYSSSPGITINYNKKSIKSGKNEKVEVTIDASKITTSLLNANLTIISNDPIHPITTIRISGLFIKTNENN